MRKLIPFLALLLIACIPSIAQAHPRKQKQHGQLTAKATSHSVTLNWTASTVPTGAPPVTGYNVKRGTATGADTQLAAAGVAITFADTTVVAGTTYFYEVTALNQCNGPSPAAACESGPSNEISVTVPNNVAPNPPGNLTGTPQ